MRLLLAGAQGGWRVSALASQTRRLRGWSWAGDAGGGGALGALHHGSLSRLLWSFLEAASTNAPEAMTRGRRRQRQDAEKPV